MPDTTRRHTAACDSLDDMEKEASSSTCVWAEVTWFLRLRLHPAVGHMPAPARNRMASGERRSTRTLDGNLIDPTLCEQTSCLTSRAEAMH